MNSAHPVLPSQADGPPEGGAPPSVRSLLMVWGALLALLAITTGSAYLNLGAGNVILNLVIATLKALLIAAFFMRLLRAASAVRLAAGAALLFLLILAFLSFGDFLTRPMLSAPWQAP